MDEALQAPRTMGRRQRAAALEARMLKHSAIYNACTMLRHSWHGSPERREECAQKMADAVVEALKAPKCDTEAVLYAVADSLTCSPLGTPWE